MTLGTGFMIVATTMPMNMMLEKMSLGMIETVKIFVLTLLFSLPFGLVVAWGRMSRIKIVKWLVNTYISIMRGTPLMLQVIWTKLFIKNTDFKRLQILCGNNFICA